MKLEFPRQVLEKYKNSKYNENPFGGSRVLASGQTDGHNRANSRFLQFWERT
jgi:hypothetical protein